MGFTKNLKQLIFGNLISKILGVLREFSIFYFFAFDLELSKYLASIAIISLLSTFSDTSILNVILFPKWNGKKPKINISLKSLSIVFALTCIIFLYNKYILHDAGSVFIQLSISSIWPLILVLSFCYSIIVYFDDFKFLRNISIINASLFLVLTLIFGHLLMVPGLIPARIFTVFFTIVIIYQRYKKRISIKFSLTQFTSSIQKSDLISVINNLVKTNQTLICLVLLKQFAAVYYLENLAAFNYGSILTITFYTLVGKNINTISLKEQIQFNSLNSKALKIYIISFISFLFCLVLGFSVVLKVNYFNITPDHIKTVITAFILTIPIGFLGYSDLLNQSRLNLKTAKFNGVIRIVIFTILTLAILNQYLLSN